MPNIETLDALIRQRIREALETLYPSLRTALERASGPISAGRLPIDNVTIGINESGKLFVIPVYFDKVQINGTDMQINGILTVIGS